MSNTIDIVCVKQALATLPNLTIDGFRHVTCSGPYPSTDEDFAERRAMFMQPEYLEQIDTACKYFDRDIEEIAGSNSYGLKHRIEDWGCAVGLASYITNGCAILAAHMSGYKLVREINSPNCRF